MTTKVPGILLQNDTVTQANLADDSVGSDQIQDNAIIENHYSDNSIPTAAYKLGSIGSQQLSDDAVISSKISDGAIIEAHYSNTSIPTSAYKLGSVGTAQLADASVTLAKMANDSVGASQLVNDAVTRDKLASGSIGTIEIEDYKITPAKLEKGTKGDIFVATEDDGSFTRFNKGDENSVLSIKNGVPSWTNNVLPTGTMLDYCGRIAPDGWLLANGRTIGNAASSANEKSDDYEELFILLWNNFSNTELPVSGGRGGSASSDWNANKTIALPDLRGRSTFGRDSMGSSSSGRIDVANNDNLGISGGVDTVTLNENQIPAHHHLMAVYRGGGDRSSSSHPSATTTINWYGYGSGESTQYALRPPTGDPASEPNVGKTSTVGGGAGGAHDNMPPYMIMTKIIKI